MLADFSHKLGHSCPVAFAAGDVELLNVVRCFGLGDKRNKLASSRSGIEHK